MPEMFQSLHGQVYEEGQVSRKMVIRHHFLNHKHPTDPTLKKLRTQWLAHGTKGMTEEEINQAYERIKACSKKIH